MNDYTNAPSTKMLATHCAVCNRALRDAVSVDLGIGPDCRKKYGYDVQVSEESRTEANTLIHTIACDRKSASVAVSIARIRDLGFAQLATTLETRIASVIISKEADGSYTMTTPYNESFVGAFRKVQGRRWDGQLKVTRFPEASKQEAWGVIKAHFQGHFLAHPRGGLVLI